MRCGKGSGRILSNEQAVIDINRQLFGRTVDQGAKQALAARKTCSRSRFIFWRCP